MHLDIVPIIASVALAEMLAAFSYPQLSVRLAVVPDSRRILVPWGDLSPRVEPLELPTRPRFFWVKRCSQRRPVGLRRVRFSLPYRRVRAVRWDKSRAFAWVLLETRRGGPLIAIRVRFFCCEEGLEVRCFHEIRYPLALFTALVSSLVQPAVTVALLLFLWLAHKIKEFGMRFYVTQILSRLEQELRRGKRGLDEKSVTSS
jgi:hypothetical protein